MHLRNKTQTVDELMVICNTRGRTCITFYRGRNAVMVNKHNDIDLTRFHKQQTQ